MPAQTFVFEYFNNLADIDPQLVLKNLKLKPEIHFLENFIANRELYPQTVAVSLAEVVLDYAIIKEAIRLDPTKIYNQDLQKIIVPACLNYFGPLPKFLPGILEVLNLGLVVEVYAQDQLVGTIVTIKIPPNTDTLTVLLNDSAYHLKGNSLSLVEVTSKTVHLKAADLPELVVKGGSLGIALNIKT